MGQLNIVVNLLFGGKVMYNLAEEAELKLYVTTTRCTGYSSKNKIFNLQCLHCSLALCDKYRA